jgi:hypothetical protein
MFVNGTQVGSTYADSTNYTATNYWTIAANGTDGGLGFNGHIDEVRVSNTARYTANFTPATAPFINDESTLLLLHMDGTDASTVFEDDNGVRTKQGMAAIGDAKVSTAQSQFGGSSAVFDGTGDWIQSASVPGFGFGTGDFTLEGWFRIANTTGIKVIVNARRGAGGNFSNVLVVNGNKLAWSDGAAFREGTTTLAINTWYHAAVSRSNGDVKLFLNGVAEYSATNTVNVGTENRVISVGAWPGGEGPMNGHIDEVRISNTARYTSNFTPSTTPFVNDDNTLLLLHMDGSNNTTYFEDDNGVRAKKGVSAVGDAKVSTAQSQFGGSSAVFDGAGDYLGIHNTSNFIFGTGNFTVEYRIRHSTQASCAHFDTRRLGLSNDTAITLFYTGSAITFYSNGAIRITGGNLANNIWYHIALVRTGNDFKLYINGTQSGSTFTAAYKIQVKATISTIGAASDNLGNLGTPGHIDEFRISNVARYTANFTPPTEPFQNDSNTLLLLHMDGTNNSTTFTDDNGVPPDHDYGA